jgi:hypothetical protein
VKISAAGEFYIELEPESQFEIDQLKRIDRPGEQYTTQLVDAPGSAYPPSMQAGAKLRILIPQHNYLGTP